MVLEGDREPVRRRTGETGRGDQPGQGGRAGFEGRQHEGSLVENSDAARVVHETILKSHIVKRKFNFPADPSIWGDGQGNTRRTRRRAAATSPRGTHTSRAGSDAGRRESDG
ncbi:hypothetical protein GCM10027168_55260 [Streptomyces capparidis]